MNYVEIIQTPATTFIIAIAGVYNINILCIE